MKVESEEEGKAKSITRLPNVSQYNTITINYNTTQYPAHRSHAAHFCHQEGEEEEEEEEEEHQEGEAAPMCHEISISIHGDGGGGMEGLEKDRAGENF